jgi:ABC-type nitrate/sulfonate/bicarbonate transport system substrate-binding protein
VIAAILLLQTLTIAVSGPPTSPEYLPLHVAAAEGYFARHGLSVTLRTARTEVDAARALADARVDLAATSLGAALRFGGVDRGTTPRLVFGLTAAPPVVLALHPSAVNSVRTLADLTGSAIGMSHPGAPEQTWLLGLLARNRMRPTSVAVVSYGDRGAAAALEAGELRAALLRDPHASRLLAGGAVRAFADLRDHRAVDRTLGRPTVNAAVFAPSRGRRSPGELEAVCRALRQAVAHAGSAAPDALADRLPPAVVGSRADFRTTLEASRALYLPDGIVTPEAVEASVELIRAHVPLRRAPRAAEVLDPAPLRRSLSPDSRPAG